MRARSRTDPSCLCVSMGPQVLCPQVFSSQVLGQVGAGEEALQTAVPEAGVALAAPRYPRSSVHHGRGGAPAGEGALLVHQGAADTGGEGVLVCLHTHTLTHTHTSILCNPTSYTHTLFLSGVFFLSSSFHKSLHTLTRCCHGCRSGRAVSVVLSSKHLNA